MNHSMPGLPVHHQLPDVTQTHIPRVSDAIQPYLILCCLLLLPPSILPSIRVFSNESTLHIRWPKYGSFSFSISPSNEHPGLISFRMDWLDLLQLKGLLRVFSNTTVQKHQFCAQLFFIVRLLHPYISTRKTIALTRQIFVDKGMSLLF